VLFVEQHGRAGAGGRRPRLRPDARPDRARGSRRRAPRAARTARRKLSRGDGRLTGAASPCLIKGLNHHERSKDETSIWLSAVALAVTGLVAAGCSSSGSSSSTGFGHRHLRQFFGRGRHRQLGVRHGEEGDRYPVCLRDDQRRDRRGHLPRGPPGRDRRRQLRQQLPRRHQRASDRDRQLHRRRHAGPRRAVRQPARGQAPDGDPRRGRRRRARLDPDLPARQPGLPGRHSVHPGPHDRSELHPVLVGQRRRQRRRRRVRGKTLGVKSVAIVYFNTPRARRCCPRSRRCSRRPE